MEKDIARLAVDPTSQVPLLLNFFIRLDLIVDLEVLEIREADAALGSLAHLLDVLLDVLQGVERACIAGVSMIACETGEECIPS